MSKIVRLGDGSDHGGSMTSAASGFNVNGIKACVDGDIHSCPISGHGDTPVTGTAQINSNGKRVIKTGDTAGCGAVIVGGSSNSTTG